MVPAVLGAAMAALHQRLDPCSAAPVVVAFSGGSDSLALLQIARAWAAAVRRPLCAMTVDHGLHPDSAAWTQAAGATAARLDLAWLPLAWTGPRPAFGLPAAARSARHALLAEAARAAGACVILLGHTADDMAESELIRAETPTHGHLAQWSPSPAWPEGRGVFLLRPLLSLRRAELRAWLTAEGATWLEDPANADTRFARSRARATLEAGSSLSEAGNRTTSFRHPPSSPSSWAGPDPQLEPDDDAMGAFGAYGVVDCDLAPGTTSGGAARLAKALLCVSGRSRPPLGGPVERILARVAAGEAFTATLSGAQVNATGGQARLTRELGRTPPAAGPLVSGVFDGRFEVTAQAPGWLIAPLAGHAAALPGRERTALQPVPARARPSLPVLLGPTGEARLPRPFGDGPSEVRCLVGERLAAALGQVASESALEATPRSRQARSAASTLILS